MQASQGAGRPDPRGRRGGGKARAALAHPVPALLVGIGLAWIALSERGRGRVGGAAGSGQRGERDDARARAEDDGGRLGRTADTPSEVPARGWLQVLTRVKDEISQDNVSIIAAGCAFYALLALFPAITALVSIYGLVADPTTVEQQLASLSGVMPQAAFDIIRDQAHEVASGGSTTLGWGAALAIVLALYSASSGIATLFTALNIAYEQEETRGLVRFYLTTFAFTLAAVVSVAFGLGVIVGVPALLRYLPLGPLADIAVRVASFAILFSTVVFGLGVIYRFGPARASARWRWLAPGSIAAAVLWLLASLAFSFYAANFASYNETYGTLGGVIILLMWLWISAYVVMLGAELNSELELQTVRDTTTGPDRPMGEREAYVADHTATDQRLPAAGSGQEPAQATA